MPIDGATHIGWTALQVPDLDRSVRFYEDILGFATLERQGRTAILGVAADGVPLLVLQEKRDATPHDPRAVGLYHFAILVPSRRNLARSLRQLAQQKYPLSGASDHLVSEALYLNDPDGNGIEIYRDRGRGEWPHAGDGQIRMATDPIDFDGIINELQHDDAPWAGLASGTTIGHMHLQVGDLAPATAFYTRVIGFDSIIQMPSASFVSAGGYHHHLGMNTWASRGGQHPDQSMAGLLGYSLVLPDVAARDAVVASLTSQGYRAEHWDAEILLRDVAGNGLALAVGTALPLATATLLDHALAELPGA